jgi:hypothetical protein
MERIQGRETSSATDADENSSEELVELLPLQELFIDVEKKLSQAVDDDGWALADIETAIFLHDALLSLRHWSDDINNDRDFVLKAVEEQDKDLANTVRLCLDDISSNVSNFRQYYEDGAFEKNLYDSTPFSRTLWLMLLGCLLSILF